MPTPIPRSLRAHPAPGFTLIELLVVISIIALLIAILLPALGKAKATTRAAQCLSNQRLLCIATQAYISDFDACYPQPGRDADIATHVSAEASVRALWFNALDYYVQQQAKTYLTAADRNYNPFKQDPIWDTFPEAGNVKRDNRTIKMNGFFGDIDDLAPNSPQDWKFIREQDVKGPAKTVLFLDGRAFDTPSITTGLTTGGDFHAEEVFAGLRHDKGGNVAFADGHVTHHRDQVRVSSTGYEGWYAGTPETNGYSGGGLPHGPHQLFWRVGR